VVVGTFGLVAPAQAADESTPDVVEAALASIAVEAPEAKPVNEVDTFDEQADGSLVAVSDNERVSVTVDAGASPDVVLETDSYAPVTISNALPGDVAIADGGTAVFESDDSYSVAPLPHTDGSVQIVTVLESRDAPGSYDFSLSGPEGLNLQIQEDGSVLLLDGNGEYAGGVGAPWAYDAEGTAVPTSFTIEGTTLKQVVDHTSGDYVYPISADPWLGIPLFDWINRDWYSGDWRVNLQPSGWAATHWFNPPTGHAILLGAGWSEAVGWNSTIGSTLQSKSTMWQQYECHIAGLPFAGTFNLERFRYNRTVTWWNGVGVHHCNWTTPTDY
jgi:hypothetical protein